MKKTIYYPVFIQCLGNITDPFWRFVYEDMAYGRCPYGLYFQKNYLCCSIKNKEFSYKIENEKTIDDIYKDTYHLLKNRVGILSEKEKLIQREKVRRLKSYHNKEEWINVKKKMIRDTLLENFVLQKANSFLLSINVSKKVLSMVIIGLMFKTLNCKDIIYANGFIQDIHGFIFQPKRVMVTKNIYLSNRIQKFDDDNNTTKYLSDYWNIYLQEIAVLVK